MKTMKLRDLLPFLDLFADLIIMEKGKDGKWRNKYPTDIMTRQIIEDGYPELLDLEIATGIHGSGKRDGIYIYLSTK
jgi:hypothetical protein